MCFHEFVKKVRFNYQTVRQFGRNHCHSWFPLLYNCCKLSNRCKKIVNCHSQHLCQQYRYAVEFGNLYRLFLSRESHKFIFFAENTNSHLQSFASIRGIQTVSATNKSNISKKNISSLCYYQTPNPKLSLSLP